MKKNVGTADRIVRILAAVVFSILYFAGIVNGTPGIVILVLSGILIITGLAGFCPLYYPFGLSSGKKIEKAG